MQRNIGGTFAALSALLLALTALPRPLCAQYATRQVNLAYLTQRADVIVQGRVARVRHAPLPGYPNIPTVEVTLEVENMLRGPRGRTYTFREVFLGLRAREGKQGYREGQRLLLFLPASSRYGLSSPVGIEQGRFHITCGSGGEEIVANEMENAGLFRNTALAARGVRLTEGQKRLLGVKRGPVRLGEMIPVIHAFTALPRIP
ncbi:MAG: hypothetical protein QM330_04655 [Acidobacteriota bacterium]|jgi:hypothetical protein|nr:hypothetical protein [Acidobacteriota bacterium]NLT32560.1 hypothetical protein [Acidobacteriota bacterium]